MTRDAIVIGAGPAGAVAAAELARGGADVLLVDGAAFPRDKVCGCCVNLAAMGTLESLGLARMLSRLGALPLRECQIFSSGRCVTLSLPGGTAVSRAAFDAALVEHAVACGVTFEPRTTALSSTVATEWRTVLLRRSRGTRSVRARIVIAADGLAGSFTRGCPGIQSVVSPRSRIGVSATVDDRESVAACGLGVVLMACARGGYVGRVRLENGRLNIAGAVDPSFIKHCGGVAIAVSKIFDKAGCRPRAGAIESRWYGTGLLTQQRTSLIDRRLFIIGDAGGYVEPFTGEGIAWALACARAISPIGLRAIDSWDDGLGEEYTAVHRRLILRRQHRCRVISWMLRRPFVTSVAVSLLSHTPAIAGPFVRAINKPTR